MVLLGGLEIVAAGYLINRHQKNKRERERIEAERLALEESSYHIFPPSSSERHRRSRSERRYDDDRDRRDGRDGRERRSSRERRRSKERRERRDSEGRRPVRPASMDPVPPRYESSSRPSKQSAPRPPVAHVPQFIPPPQQPIPQQAYTPPPPPQQPQAQQYPPDIKYGWTPSSSPPPSSSSSSVAGPPTGWPSHWEQSQRPERSALRPDNESGRGRSNSRVRFDVSGEPQPGERARSWSPPPEYKP
ncbi:hypothetical protein B0J14DRAFT_251662 [Halenospora varia]|nr:hypothetical protein B0J14DRAFT_251662 [Halenospora varia]